MPQGHKKKPRPRLLIVGPRPEARGGIAHLIAIEMRAIPPERFDVATLGTHDTVSKLGKLLIAARAYGRLWLLLLGKRTDIAHVHFADGPSLARKIPFLLTLRLFGVPYVLSDHQDWAGREYPRRGRLMRRLARAIFERASAILVLGPRWKESYEALLRRPVPVILVKNCIDTGEYAYVERPAKRDRVRFVSIGILGKRKGTFDLIEASARLRERFDGFSVVIAGNGEVERARARARERGLEKHVACPGWLSGDAVKKALADADVFVLPSYREGMPLSIVQAMSVGLPIVSTNVDGIPAIVRDGENGFLLEPGDVGALAERMEILALDGELRLKMGRRSRRIAETELSIERVMGNLADLFAKISEHRPIAGENPNPNR